MNRLPAVELCADISAGSYVSATEAATQLAAGRPVIIVQGGGSRRRGALAAAASEVTPNVINFMVRHARGVVALALTPQRCEQLELTPLGRRESGEEPRAMVSIEAREGVTTGISAHDRARTIQVAVDPGSTPDSLVKPGHIFPTRVSRDGSLANPRIEEAAVDLTQIGGVTAGAVVCDILDPDGDVAGPTALESVAALHGLAIVTVDDVVDHRRRHERLLRRGATASLPTKHGSFRVVAFWDLIEGSEHAALIKGRLEPGCRVPVAVHRQCLIGEAFGSLRCDCAGRLTESMERFERLGSGVIVYLGNVRRELHLTNEIDRFEWRDELGFAGAGVDDHQRVDQRGQIVVEQILRDLGITGSHSAGSHSAISASERVPEGVVIGAV